MVIVRLIIVNVAAYLLLQGVWMLTPDSVQTIVDGLALPSSFDEWLRMPWTLLTYSFIHLDLRHLAVNLLWLGCVAAMPIHRSSRKSIYMIYAVSAIAGGVIYLLAGVFSAASEAILVGCSAATFGILGALPWLPWSRRILFRNYWLCVPGLILCLLSCLFIPLAQGLTHLAGFAAGAVIGKVSLPQATGFSPQQNGKECLSSAEHNVPESLLEKARHSGFNALDSIERTTLINACSANGENHISQS